MSPLPSRRAPRFALLIEVEVMAVSTRERIRSFTSNVSRTGCYVATANPFSNFAQLWVQLTKGGQQIEAEGAVAHATGGQGMGISFETLHPEHQAILDGWLAEAEQS